MHIIRNAFKAFLKAWKNPEKAKAFLEEKETKPLKEDSSHLHLLALLQNEGRLIDFLKDDISSFSDEEVGKAVRKIHESTSKSLESYVTLRPVMTTPEGSKVTVPQGYDPSAIKIVGKVKGNAPYIGTLRHSGWKAHKLSLPKALKKQDETIVFPAEVEI